MGMDIETPWRHSIVFNCMSYWKHIDRKQIEGIISFFILLVFTLGTVPHRADAQVTSSSARSAAQFDSLKARFNLANSNKDYGSAADIMRQMIALGHRDSGMYYKLAAVTGMAGDKAQGRKYLDTAERLGWNLDADGGQIRMLLGIASSHDAAFAQHPAASFRRVQEAARRASNTRPHGMSATLFRMRYEDQNEREPLQALLLAGSNIPVTSYERLLATEDAKRRAEVYRMLKRNAIASPLDLEAAALILQHGNDTTDFWTAHTLAMRSVALGDEDARWLAAATLDRYLMTKQLPQKYGTQTVLNPATGKMELYTVDPMTTDSERAAWHVPPLEQEKNIDK